MCHIASLFLKDGEIRGPLSLYDYTCHQPGRYVTCVASRYMLRLHDMHYDVSIYICRNMSELRRNRANAGPVPRRYAYLLH